MRGLGILKLAFTGAFLLADLGRSIQNSILPAYKIHGLSPQAAPDPVRVFNLLLRHGKPHRVELHVRPHIEVSMFHATPVRLAFAMLAAATVSLATAAVPVAGGGCGGSSTNDKGKVPLASMHSDVPLYVARGSGRVVEMDLRSGTSTTLSDHGFYGTPTLHLSGNGRWLSYDGSVEATSTSQYWLYDRRARSERLIYEHPQGGRMTTFSPDSRYLAISATYHDRWPDATRAGLFLFDTTSMRLQRIPLPVRKNLPDLILAAWPQDGKALLIMMNTDRTRQGSEYFSYDLATRRMETITGGYNREANRHEFFRGAQRILTTDDIVPPTGLDRKPVWAPGRSWQAHIDEHEGNPPTYALRVTGKQGTTRTAATGYHSHCMGRTLAIHGWLDDRHLIYRNAMDYLMFDAQTGTTADLLTDKDWPFQFTW